jgi:integrase
LGKVWAKFAMSKAKKAPIAKLPPSVHVQRESDGWRVRLGKRFTGSDEVRRRFESLGEAREWIHQQGQARHQLHASALTPAQLGDAKTALDILAARGTLTAAAEFYSKHHRRPDETLSLEEAVKQFLAAKGKKGLRPRSLQAYSDTLSLFSKDFSCTVANITGEDLTEWLDEDDWQLPTVLHHQTNLSVFLNWSVKKGWLTTAPTETIEKPTLGDTPPGILTVSQLAELLTTAHESHPTFLPLLAIGAFAGLRTSELQKLDWSEVNLEERTIEVTAAKSKTRQRRIVDITENLAAWLSPQTLANGPVWPAAYRYHIAELRVAAGITTWPKNALRHSFASYHLAHHRDAGRTANQLGHRDSQMLFAHYRELVRPREAKKYWEILPKK